MKCEREKKRRWKANSYSRRKDGGGGRGVVKRRKK